MMVGGGGAPPWPRGLVQTGSAHRVGHRLVRLGAAPTFGQAHGHALPYLSRLITRGQGARML